MLKQVGRSVSLSASRQDVYALVCGCVCVPQVLLGSLLWKTGASSHSGVCAIVALLQPPHPFFP